MTNAQGRHTRHGRDYILVDLPGTYSLLAHSAEEEVARDFLCFGGADASVVVCDATCLERNLNLVLQTLEITPWTVVCVNLMDEARSKGIEVDLKALSGRLGVPVVGTSAGRGEGLERLMDAVEAITERQEPPAASRVSYPAPIEAAAARLAEELEPALGGRLPSRWVALRLLDGDPSLMASLTECLGRDLTADRLAGGALEETLEGLQAAGWSREQVREAIVAALVRTGAEIAGSVVACRRADAARRDRRLDRLLTSRATGIPVMLCLLALVFWITIAGANAPSALLADGLFWVQDRLTDLFWYLQAPDWLHGALVLGVYRVLAWVVSVMLPPMAIFFPLFTLLEDAGYLPRVAYNLDRPFKRCCACGKQALCMCMGFGCNAAGVIGCRIIDSPRERLLAILTNNFVPCNGRFPTLIALLTMFFVGAAGGAFSSLLSALLLTGVIVLGVVMTFVMTRLLSKTLLRGVPSSFTLELPPYRRPQIGRVLLRSVFDRTLFVLGRAAAVAAPAGLVIWLMANVTVGGASVLNHCAAFLDPLARLLGLDGVILLAFLLGFPANEIVIPIVIMAYMAQGSLVDLGDLAQMKALFAANGWTWATAVSTMLFSLMHWPCSTTLLTIKKETGSWKWTALAAALPTAAGALACMAFTAAVRLIG